MFVVQDLKKRAMALAEQKYLLTLKKFMVAKSAATDPTENLAGKCYIFNLVMIHDVWPI